MAEYSYGYDNGGRERTDAGGGSRAVVCPNCGELLEFTTEDVEEE